MCIYPYIYNGYCGVPPALYYLLSCNALFMKCFINTLVRQVCVYLCDGSRIDGHCSDDDDDFFSLQIFYPITTDLYDRKNMPRVIYCIHAVR